MHHLAFVSLSAPMHFYEFISVSAFSTTQLDLPQMHVGLKCLILIFLCTTAICYGQSNPWAWAVYGKNSTLPSGGIYGDGSSTGYGTTTDDLGNVYTVGYFTGSSMTLESVTLTNRSANIGTAPNTEDIFVVKHDGNGHLIWATSFGGVSSERAFSVSVDHDGNVYVGGYFDSPTVVFGDTTLSNLTTQEPLTYPAFFVVKLDPMSNVLWARTGYGNSTTQKVVCDNVGDVFIYGTFGSTGFTIGNQTFLDPWPSAFVAKYSDTGSLEWVKRISSALLGWNFNAPMAIGSDNRLYLAGSFLGDGFFADDLYVSAPSPPADPAFDQSLFLVCLDREGSIMWGRSYGGNAGAQCHALSLDESGMIYITGSFMSASISFDNIEVVNPLIGTGSPPFIPGHQDGFVVKLNPEGKVKWANAINGSGSQMTSAIHAGLAGKLFVTGFLDGSDGPDTIQFNSLKVFASSEYHQSFVAQYDTAGTAFFVDLADASSTGIASDALGAIYVTGASGSTGFGGGATEARASFFLSKMTPCGRLVVVNADPVALCDEGVVVLTSESKIDNNWSTGETTRSITVTSPGRYDVTAFDSATCWRKKMITEVVALSKPPALNLILERCTKLKVSPALPATWFYLESEIATNLSELTPVDPGAYYVELKNECGTSRSNVVTFIPMFDTDSFSLPNVITPNGDSFNEHLVIDQRFEGASLNVINRWGGIVYTAYPYDNSWNGDGLAAGVYYYTITHSCLAEPLKGIIQIQR
jgi:hypothetical protein